MSETFPVSVLFVCMGNICRSPTGEGVFKKFVDEQGYTDHIRIDSAGTIAYHTGHPADQRMQRSANRRGYRLDSIARQVNKQDLEDFSLIVAMDDDNLNELEYLAGGPRPHIRMLGSFLDDAPDQRRGRPVPDPYYGGEKGFEAVLDMIEAACPGMFDHCLELMKQRRA
ncbi:MAG: low molecular weight phosphotyrosine protein phosphatase [Thiotrichales bacterium]|nr:low molecular weight phosphotyrosine protein phosphatase [Thiotrichales bacterium]